MAGHCPACFIRLPLSGEANCDCEPPAVGGPVADGRPTMTPVLQALLDRTEGRADVVGRFGAWYSQCLICGLDSGPWFTRLKAAASGLLHLDKHHARLEADQDPLPLDREGRS